jgi:hypothetical protein
MLVCNVLMMSNFLVALEKKGSLMVVIKSSSINMILTGIFGLCLLGENVKDNFCRCFTNVHWSKIAISQDIKNEKVRIKTEESWEKKIAYTNAAVLCNSRRLFEGWLAHVLFWIFCDNSINATILFHMEWYHYYWWCSYVKYHEYYETISSGSPNRIKLHGHYDLFFNISII